jgi:anhydro-N-acetylmuramic acid kinase
LYQLGGFANISFDQQQQRIAFDICPANIVLNFLCKELDLLYDDEGLIARQGHVNTELLTKLNDLEFYRHPPPKSLGKEWVLQYIFPLINSASISINDKLRTVTEHIAMQIAAVINSISGNNKQSQVLVTGGGAFNRFLIERITALTNHKLVIPDKKIINYKEALLFAFLGVLRWKQQQNALRSVTGAKSDSVGGCIYWH